MDCNHPYIRFLFTMGCTQGTCIRQIKKESVSKSDTHTIGNLVTTNSLITIDPRMALEKESSKMKCNTLSGKLFFTIKMALTKSVAYESLYSIEI